MKVAFLDLKKQYLAHREEIDAATERVVEACDFIGGEEVNRFEAEFARACGAKYCIGVGNGTDALFIALKALDIGPGDEVITVANSYFATAEAISLTGAQPVFVDCHPNTYNIDCGQVEAYLQDQRKRGKAAVKAILPVHLYGRMAPMGELLALARQYGLKIVEDCAQGHLAEFQGRKAGAIGDIGCFSFYPSKNLGAFGDAGAVVTDNDELATRMRMFANHGQAARYDHKFPGVNSRLDGLQAAVLNVKLRYLRNWSDQRYNHAMLYRKWLEDNENLILPEIPERGSHVFHLFVVRVGNRERVMRLLQERGVATVVHYPTALPNLEAFRHLGHRPEDFPVASAFQEEVLSLPLYPELTEEEIHYVAKSLRDILS